MVEKQTTTKKLKYYLEWGIKDLRWKHGRIKVRHDNQMIVAMLNPIKRLDIPMSANNRCVANREKPVVILRVPL
jgi:hypothetical protein